MNHKNKQEPIIQFLNTGMVIGMVTCIVLLIAGCVTAFDVDAIFDTVKQVLLSKVGK